MEGIMFNKYRNPRVLVLSLILAFCASGAMAAGIKVVPSAARVSPGETFSVDVVAEGIPSEGLGTVQFRLNVNAAGGSIAGVSDLIQAKSGDISVSTPLQISSPSSTRSGFGDFFWNGRSSHGVLVMDNEPLNNGSALYTYAHTNGAALPVGSGTVARFQLAVGSAVEAENINISLSDVMLLDGGTEYPLEYNNGATVQLRCMTTIPSLLGLALSEAKTAIEGANLTLGNVYEIGNNGSRSLNAVLEQSSQSGASLLCQTPVDIAINTAPTDVTQATAADEAGDDTGVAILSWVPSSSADVAGYKVYSSSTPLKTINAPSATGTEIGGLINGAATQLRVTAYDTYGNESQGVAIQATALDDVPPVITVEGVQEGLYYSTDVTPVVNVFDNHLSTKAVTLNNSAYNGEAIALDGSYSLSIAAADLSGNLSSKTVGFAVDKTPPAISIAGVEEGRYYNTDLSPVVTVSDANLKEKTVTLNGQPYNGASITAEGSYTLAINAVDVVGHTSNEARNFHIDKTAPASTNSIGSPKVEEGGNIFMTGSTPVTLSATDFGVVSSGINRTEYTIDGSAWNNYVSGITLSGVADGQHNISYKSADNAENVETVMQLNVTVDNSAPVTAITVGEPKFQAQDGSFFINQGTAFTLSASDAYSGVSKTEYRLNSGQWTAYAPFNLSNEGAYQIEYRSTDRLGNTETSKSLNAIVDNTPPVSNLTLETPKHEVNGSIYISGNTSFTLGSSDNLSGIRGIEYRVDGGQWTEYTAFFNLSTLSDGQHTIYYRASDNVGNAEPEKTLTFIIDNTPPETAITVSMPKFIDANGGLYITKDTEFTLSSEDNLSGVSKVEYRIDSGTWTEYAAFKISSEGSHIIGFRSADNLGNTETEKTLSLTVDNTPPVSSIATGEPKHTASDGTLFVTGSTSFILTASDSLSGVAKTEYRIDSGTWTAYASPFSIPAESSHLIEYRSSDNVGNMEATKYISVTVDNAPPVTGLTAGSPKYETENILYVAGKTVFTLAATDNLSGVKDTEYKVDNSTWITGASLSVPDEGNHTIVYRSRDNVENLETEKTINIIVDNTPPITTVEFNQQNYTDGQNVLVSRNTQVILASTDNLSGVKATYYRFDDEDGWYTYSGAFRLTDLTFGTHTIRYRSADNVENSETEKTVTVVLVGVDVETNVMNLPRVLVWTRDPSKIIGNKKPTYTLDDIKSFVSDALNDKDIYFKMTTDKDEFLKEFRSGIYNMAAVIDQDTPFDAIFLREMREAVNSGMGLLVSGWGNTTPPILEEALGVQVSGSLSTTDSDRTIYLYQSPVSPEQSLTAKGRILKASLTTGTLAGIVKGEETCDGIKGISFKYQTDITSGDMVKASLYSSSGKKLTLVDEETLSIESLPSDGINSYAGNASGDIGIDSSASDGVTFSVKAPSGYLGSSYYVSLTVQHQDGGNTSTGSVAVAPTCGANLQSGVAIGPFNVTAVEADSHKITDDLPAVVLNNYGKGRAVFLSYDIVESAMNRNMAEYAWMLKNAMNYILPQEVKPEAAGISLLETKIKLHGTPMDLKAVDTLGEGLTLLPLFSLTKTPLEYTFHLSDGEETAYRYFVRVKDKIGSYGKDTDIYLGIGSGYTLFDKYQYAFAIDTDSDLLIQQAVAWVNEQLAVYSEATDSLNTIYNELVTIAFMPKHTAADVDKVIHQIIQTIHHINQLPFDTTRGREILDGYLKVMEGDQYFY